MADAALGRFQAWLRLQVFVLSVLTLGGAAWCAYAVFRQESAIGTRHELVHRAHDQCADAALAAGALREQQGRGTEALIEHLAAAEAILTTLVGMGDHLIPSVQTVQEAIDDLNRAVRNHATAAAGGGEAGEEAVNQAASRLADAARALHDVDAAEARALRKRAFTGALGGFLLMFVAYTASALRARALFRAEREALLGAITRDAARVADALQRAHQEGATEITEEVRPELAGVMDATRATARLLGDLRANLVHQERDVAFARDLGLAFDLADTEAEVLSTVRLATRVAFPGARVQFWMADNSHAELVPAFRDAPRRCAPPRPYACPALRRSSVEVQRGGVSLGRCPHADAGDEVMVCAFVAVGGRAVGALQFMGPTVDEEARPRALAMAAALGTRLTVVRTLDERELQASTDVLTGLANRRRMNHLLARLDRDGSAYAVIVADLDHFKRINDTYGHEVGDRCLKVFAQTLRDGCREGDLPCRPGGEEFAVVLPRAGLDAARAVAERIRVSLESASRATGIGFSASFGVAARPRDGEDANAVLSAADAALYRAKESGRNRVCAAGEADDGPAGLVAVEREDEGGGLSSTGTAAAG